MKDVMQRIEKLRTDAEDCNIISKLATNPAKREVFRKLTEEYHKLAQELERLVASGDLPG